MKAYRITSTEYQANIPSVFLFVNGEYHGCMIYPKHRNYPQDVDYWRTATCADDGRYFHVEEVEVDENDIAVMKQKQSDIEGNRSKLKDYSGYRPFATKEEKEADYQHDIEAEKYNCPIEREINRLWTEIRNMILELEAV